MTLGYWTDEREPAVVVRPRAWKRGDVRRVLRVIKEETGMIGPLEAAKFWRAIVLTARLARATRREIEGLTVGDVFIDGLLFRSETAKDGRDRWAPIGDSLILAMVSICKPHREIYFPIEEAGGWREIKRSFRVIVERAGLDPDAFTLEGLRLR